MKIRTLILSLAVLFGVQAFAQMDQTLPKDPAVRYGKLDNGLTYYIRHNEKPENRANFYIAQRVGSILENEEQRGLAHFLEHMCFNGTKNFPDKDIINYLEKNGVAFGGDLNAYTGIDEAFADEYRQKGQALLAKTLPLCDAGYEKVLEMVR